MQHGTLLESELTTVVFLVEHVVGVLVGVDTELLLLLLVAEGVVLVLGLVAVHASLVQLETDLGAVLGTETGVEVGGAVHNDQTDIDEHQELGHGSTGQSEGHQGEETHVALGQTQALQRSRHVHSHLFQSVGHDGDGLGPAAHQQLSLWLDFIFLLFFSETLAFGVDFLSTLLYTETADQTCDEQA